MSDDLGWVKQQKWFYEFVLPDGTVTEGYLPEIARKIHVTREIVLRQYLKTLYNPATAIDVSCHEGFYSLVLAEYFDSVIGLDKNQDSLNKASRISNLLGKNEIRFEKSSIENWNEVDGADFILCFGLLYHVENPIEIVRKLSLLAKKSICIETQVMPFQISGAVEDGSYMWQRDINGLFGLCVDYSHSKEGGLSDLALVPSRDGLEFLLTTFGFKKIKFYQPNPDDYEQFVRNQRVIVFAEK